jgi:hypothetical protein
MEKQIPQCSLCQSTMTWKVYDNPQGGFWTCKNWKIHKDAGQSYKPVFPHPATGDFKPSPKTPESPRDAILMDRLEMIEGMIKTRTKDLEDQNSYLLKTLIEIKNVLSQILGERIDEVFKG